MLGHIQTTKRDHKCPGERGWLVDELFGFLTAAKDYVWYKQP
jgi:hypothetical protein